jgi:hypothetical protein
MTWEEVDLPGRPPPIHFSCAGGHVIEKANHRLDPIAIARHEVGALVRPDRAELRFFAGKPHDVVDSLAGELRPALRDTQPGQIILPGGEVAFDGAELVPPGSRRRK